MNLNSGFNEAEMNQEDPLLWLLHGLPLTSEPHQEKDGSREEMIH